MNNEEKKQLDAAINAQLAKRVGNAPANVSTPLLDKDTVTFKNVDVDKLDTLLVYHAPNGSIGEYYTVKATDGREVSQKQLCRIGNGLGLVGDTPDERLKDFIALIQDKSEVTIKVAKSRIAPSTNPEYNGTRVITWEPIVR